MHVQKYLAFDIGGTDIKYGIVDSTGKILHHNLFPNRIRSHGVDTMLADLVQVAQRVTTRHEITAVGISTSGVVDMATGIMLYGADTFPGYKGKNPGKLVTEATGLPCYVDNDVNCAALGEYYFGMARGKSPVCCVSMGTGIGGATLVDGKLLYGTTYYAGEVGHFPIPGGEFEKVASTSALVRYVAERKGLTQDQVNGKLIFAWAQAGDEVAKEGIERMVAGIAQGLSYLIYAINPQVIVLGGAVSAQDAYLKPRVAAKLQEFVLPALYEATEIAYSELDNTASMLGAITPFLDSSKL